MNGIIIVDKPSGWTSHDVIAKLRGVLKIKRIGHSGTLDPMATGVLVVFLGRATRAAEFVESADKEYIAGLKPGISTDTQDVTGTVLTTSDASVSAMELSEVIPRFLGEQKQTPPMYSAVKINGKKLYELARRGIEVQRPVRDVYISEIELLESGEDGFLLRVVCSKGTYVRALCHDIGVALGCGGVLSSLRRVRAGAFTIEMAYTIEDIIAAVSSGNIQNLIIPVDTVFSGFPSVSLGEEETHKCINGAVCKISGLPDGKYRFYDNSNNFLLFGEIKDNMIKVIKSFYDFYKS